MRIQIFDYFVIDLAAISACGFFAVAQPVSPNVPGLLRNSHETHGSQPRSQHS